MQSIDYLSVILYIQEKPMAFQEKQEAVNISKNSFSGDKNLRNILIILALLLTGVSAYWLWPSKDTSSIHNVPMTVSRIVCFGDSLTYGYGASEHNDYPSRLEEMTGIETINAGVSGNTTTDGLARLENDVLGHNPDVVLITLGGNDLKNRIDVTTAQANLVTIIEKIQATGAMVILGGIEIPLYGKNYTKMYQTVAQETGSVLIPNILEGLIGHPDLMTDSIHPNDQGYAIMAERFYNALIPFLPQ